MPKPKQRILVGDRVVITDFPHRNRPRSDLIGAKGTVRQLGLGSRGGWFTIVLDDGQVANFRKGAFDKIQSDCQKPLPTLGGVELKQPLMPLPGFTGHPLELNWLSNLQLLGLPFVSTYNNVPTMVRDPYAQEIFAPQRQLTMVLPNYGPSELVVRPNMATNSPTQNLVTPALVHQHPLVFAAPQSRATLSGASSLSDGRSEGFESVCSAPSPSSYAPHRATCLASSSVGRANTVEAAVRATHRAAPISAREMLLPLAELSCAAFANNTSAR